MKMMMNVLIIAMAVSAVAQNPSTVMKNVKNQVTGAQGAPSPAVSTVKPGVKPAVGSPAPIVKKVVQSPAPKPTVSVKPTKAAVSAKGTGAVVRKVVSAKKVTPGVAAEKPASQQASNTKRSAEGRRDPFVSPVVESKIGTSSGCSSGKKCLVADQISVKGIVKTLGANIAVVVTADNRAYFLHENDPIYNGVVTKITGDSVTIREQIKDVLGRPATREVVKRINTSA